MGDPIRWCLLCWWFIGSVALIGALPESLLYPHDAPQTVYLPPGDDISSGEVTLRVPVVYYGVPYDSLYVNLNGFISFLTDVPLWINAELPLDYPMVAAYYSNVDTRRAGNVSYLQTDDPQLLARATETVHDAFTDATDFRATGLFIATWEGVGYYPQGTNRTNTFQIVLSTDGASSYAELLYPEGGLNWLRGGGDASGLPDARAQAALISHDGRIRKLPGSGTDQVVDLDKWSNMGLNGQFIFRIDSREILEPDLFNQISTTPLTCSEAPTACHAQARCVDYEEGFCCECNERYYGNGKFCVKKDVPLRVNGKVNGKINGERLENLDLQSYIVMSDGRAYTAMSKIPESVGYDAQTLQILGGVIGYLFARPVRNALNGYQLTGGVFNHTATVTFLNTSQTVRVRQRYHGLDVFDQLRLDADVQGELPVLPNGAHVTIDEYDELYTRTAPNMLQSASQRVLTYTDVIGEERALHYSVEQAFVFDSCPFENVSVGESWRLRVGRNFISYEAREQIVRFGLSNKITPSEEYDPCAESRDLCPPHSSCVPETSGNTAEGYTCACHPGYQQHVIDGRIVCADVDECAAGRHECSPDARCTNTDGGYMCQCLPGYEGDGYVCDYARTCANVTCNENAECVVGNNGLAVCRCMAGFAGNGQTCAPLSSQSCHVANNCSPFGACAIDPRTNTYYCTCLPGYLGDGYRCEPAPPTTTPLPLPEETTTVGGQEEDYAPATVPQSCLFGFCSCPEGYNKVEGTSYCAQLPETTTATEPVSDGSCAVLNNCHRDASCMYDPALGRSRCVCNPGYEGDGYTCTAIATCSSNQDCAPAEECTYTSSRKYECVCKEGYTRDSQHICVPIAGSCGGGTCVENAECVYDDEYQTFYCRCKAGYVGDGITECREKVIGCDTLNNCGLHATCRYEESELTYVCRCNPGFFGDGFNCYAERNCLVDPTMCDPHAECVTDADRRYVCQCKSGYVGDGTVCREITRPTGPFLLLNQGTATLKVPLQEEGRLRGKPLQVRDFQTAVGLAVDCLEGRFYWSDIGGNRAIRSARLDGTDKIDFIDKAIGSPEGLAVDWVSRNIYWTDSTNDTIEVTNIDSKRRRTLFNTNLVNPRGIAVHPQRGKIFWTDWDRRHPRIEWAKADGTGRQIFMEGESTSLPNSLAIDYDTEQVCYADAGTKKIECIGIDSRIKQTIAVNCTYPFGIAVTDTQIYWSDWISKKIERVDKYSLRRLPPLSVPIGGSGNKLFGLAVGGAPCPPLSNVCQSASARCPSSHICLPDGRGSRRCLCAYKADAPDEQPDCAL